MKIIIVGLGRTGISLIEMLEGAGHEIVCIEKDAKIVEEVTNEYSVNGVVGSGASKATLLKAGADTADIVIALTPVDEINIMCGMQAKSLGTKKACVRLAQHDFAMDMDFIKEEYELDYIIRPRYDMAVEIARNIGLPGNVKIEGYFDDAAAMVNMVVKKDSPLVGKKLFEVKNFLQADVLVTTVLRKGKLYVPDGNFELQLDDCIELIASLDDLKQALMKLELIQKPAKKVLIVGCGITGEYLTDMLINDKKSVTVIIDDKDRCRELMEKYEKANVVYGDIGDTDILEEEGIENFDVCVSITAKDETNLVTSLFAWSQGVPSIITRVDKPGHVKLMHKVDMDITLSPSEISVMKLLRFIRNYEMGDSLNDIKRYYCIADAKAEAMEFEVKADMPNRGIAFKSPEFKLKKDTLIAAILRDGNMFIPDGNAKIEIGDHLVVVTSKKNELRKMNDIFAK